MRGEKEKGEADLVVAHGDSGSRHSNEADIGKKMVKGWGVCLPLLSFLLLHVFVPFFFLSFLFLPFPFLSFFFFICFPRSSIFFLFHFCSSSSFISVFFFFVVLLSFFFCPPLLLVRSRGRGRENYPTPIQSC